MSPITTTIEANRPAEDVFAYVTNPARSVEWQHGVASGHMVGDAPHVVGGRRYVKIDLDFTGHGVGKLLVPLFVRPSARKEMPSATTVLLRDRCTDGASRMTDAPAPELASPRNSRLSGTNASRAPLTDSNRRPLPYHA